jgi:hypothetical protein
MNIYEFMYEASKGIVASISIGRRWATTLILNHAYIESVILPPFLVIIFTILN